MPNSRSNQKLASGARGHGYFEKHKSLVLLVMAMTVFIAAIIAMTCGAYNISVGDVFKTLGAHLTPWVDHSEVSKLHHTIIWKIRLPRILLAISVGISLATAGAVFQGCFRNPLVEPYILGASQGAAFGAALGMVFPGFFLTTQALAFIFSLVAVVGAYSLARIRGETPVVTLILAGMIIASVFYGLVSIMKYLATNTVLRGIIFWMMGGFYYAAWDDVALVGLLSLACFLVMWALGWKLNILSMGDEEARTLGVSPEKYKLILITLATLSTAVSVSSVGIIAWVGLMMPHATRLLLGPDHQYLLPAAAMLGSIYLIFCDTLARTLTSSEIPVGILTSLIAAPYLFYLLRSRGRNLLG